MRENNRNGRRVVPLPFQGHINPMLQLANILYTKGFSITIIHTNFNSPTTFSNYYPNFTFVPISDGLSATESSNKNILDLLLRLNSNCIPTLRGSLSSLLSNPGPNKEKIACLITDAHWYFAQDVADSFGLPRLVLQTLKLSWFLGFTALKGVTETTLHFPTQDSDEADSPVIELPPLRTKDLPLVLGDPRVCLPILASIVEATKASSGVIFNSCDELEQDLATSFVDEFGVPVFLIGPLHGYFSASSSSLLTQDQTCLQWLDKQESKSVIYASFGSLATVSKEEFLEIAWGLRNTNHPFLWVVRPGSVQDSEWIEALPDGLMEDVNGRGKMVKWAPQQDVLSHPATGVFWTHNGWNSTLESICEGVPMICRPTIWDQIPNARFVSEVWRVGIHLENNKKLDRGEIEKAVRVLMVDSEGEEIRRRMKELSEKLGKCLLEGGSSYESLENLVCTISSF